MTTIKLGDKVTATYGRDSVTGIVAGFSGGYVSLDFTEPQHLWNRVESDGCVIHPMDRHTIVLVEAGPAISDDDMVEVPGHGNALCRRAL